MPSGDFEAFPPLRIVFWEVEWGPQNSNTLALKIHMVLNCKSADSQQTEGQAPATLVWFGFFKQLNEWQSLNVSGEVQRAMRRIYWKGARRGSFPVAGVFPGKKKKRENKQLHPNVSWEFANLFLSLSPSYLHCLSEFSIGKGLGFFHVKQ